MESLWLYTRNGFTTGPVSTAKLARMVLDRQLKRNSIVCSVSTGLWQPVSEIHEVIRIVNRSIAGNCTDEKEIRLFRSFLAAEERYPQNVNFDDLYPNFSNLSWKLIPWLSLVTLGLFQLYWFFRQGIRADSQDVRRQKISIFVFLVPLFTFMGIEANKQFRRVKPAAFNPIFLGMLWYLSIILCFVNVIPDDKLLSDLINLVAYVFTSVPLMMAQKYINDCFVKLDQK